MAKKSPLPTGLVNDENTPENMNAAINASSSSSSVTPSPLDGLANGANTPERMNAAIGSSFAPSSMEPLPTMNDMIGTTPSTSSEEGASSDSPEDPPSTPPQGLPPMPSSPDAIAPIAIPSSLSEDVINRNKPIVANLHHKLQSKAWLLLEAAREHGLNVHLSSGYRSNDEQDRLYAQGRTAPGKKVTNARGGESNHNHRVAFDVVIIGEDGKPNWDEKLYDRLGEIGHSIGLEWGGDWKSFKDRPHFQLPGGRKNMHEHGEYDPMLVDEVPGLESVIKPRTMYFNMDDESIKFLTNDLTDEQWEEVQSKIYAPNAIQAIFDRANSEKDNATQSTIDMLNTLKPDYAAAMETAQMMAQTKANATWEMFERKFARSSERMDDIFEHSVDLYGRGQITLSHGATKPLPQYYLNWLENNRAANIENARNLAMIPDQPQVKTTFGGAFTRHWKGSVMYQFSKNYVAKPISEILTGDFQTDRKFVENRLEHITNAMRHENWSQLNYDQWEVLSKTQNMNQFTRALTEISKEVEAENYLANVGVLKSLGAGLAAGILDPTNLIPGGVILGRTARGKKLLDIAASTLRSADRAGDAAATAKAVGAFKNALARSRRIDSNRALQAATLAGSFSVADAWASDQLNPYNNPMTLGDYAVSFAFGGVFGFGIDYAAAKLARRRGALDIQEAQRIAAKAAEAKKILDEKKKAWENEADAAGIKDPEARASFIYQKEEAEARTGLTNITGARRESVFEGENLREDVAKEAEIEEGRLRSRKSRDSEIKSINKEIEIQRAVLRGSERQIKMVEELGDAKVTEVDGVKVVEGEGLRADYANVEKNMSELQDVRARLQDEADLTDAKLKELNEKRHAAKNEIRQSINHISAKVSKVKKAIKEYQKKLDELNRESSEGWDFRNLRMNNAVRSIVKSEEADVITNFGPQINRSGLESTLETKNKKISDFEAAALTHRRLMEREANGESVSHMRKKIEDWFERNNIDVDDAIKFADNLLDRTPYKDIRTRKNRANAINRNRGRSIAKRKGANLDNIKAKQSEIDEFMLEIENLELSLKNVDTYLGEIDTQAKLEQARADTQKQIRNINRNLNRLETRRQKIEAAIARREGIDVNKAKEEIEEVNQTIKELEDQKEAAKNAHLQASSNFAKANAIRQARAEKYGENQTFDADYIENAQIMDLIEKGAVDKADLEAGFTKQAWDKMVNQTRKLRGSMASHAARIIAGPLNAAALVGRLVENPISGRSIYSTGAQQKAMLEKKLMGRVNFLSREALKAWKDYTGATTLEAFFSRKSREAFYDRFHQLMEARYRGEDVTNEKDFPVFADLIAEHERINMESAKLMQAAGIEGSEGLDQRAVGYVPRLYDPRKVAELFGNQERAIAFRDYILSEFKKNKESGGIFADLDDAQLAAIADGYVNLQQVKINGNSMVEFSTKSPSGRYAMMEAIEENKNISEVVKARLRNKMAKPSGNLKDRLEFDVHKPIRTSSGETFKIADYLVKDLEVLNERRARVVSGQVVMSNMGLAKSPREVQLMVKAMTHELSLKRGSMSKEEIRAAEEQISSAKTILSSYTGIRFDNQKDPAIWSAAIRSLARSTRLGGLGWTQLGELATFSTNHGFMKTLLHSPALIKMWRRNVHYAKTGQYESDDMIRFVADAMGSPEAEGYTRGIDTISSMAGEAVDNPLNHPVLGILKGMENVSGILSGMRAAFGAMRRMSMQFAVSDIIKAIDTGKVSRSLREAGFDDELLKEVQANKHLLIDDSDGIRTLNPTNMEARDTNSKLLGIIHRVMDKDVQTSRMGEGYGLLEGDIMSIIGQFKSFVFLAKDKNMNNLILNRGVFRWSMGAFLASPFILGPHIMKSVVNTIGMSDDEREEYLDKRLSPERLGMLVMDYSPHIGLFNEGLPLVEFGVSAAEKLGVIDEKPEIFRSRERKSGVLSSVPAGGVIEGLHEGVTEMNPKLIFNNLPLSMTLPFRVFSNLIFSED